MIYYLWKKYYGSFLDRIHLYHSKYFSIYHLQFQYFEKPLGQMMEGKWIEHHQIKIHFFYLNLESRCWREQEMTLIHLNFLSLFVNFVNLIVKSLKILQIWINHNFLIRLMIIFFYNSYKIMFIILIYRIDHIVTILSHIYRNIITIIPF